MKALAARSGLERGSGSPHAPSVSGKRIKKAEKSAVLIRVELSTPLSVRGTSRSRSRVRFYADFMQRAPLGVRVLSAHLFEF